MSNTFTSVGFIVLISCNCLICSIYSTTLERSEDSLNNFLPRISATKNEDLKVEEIIQSLILNPPRNNVTKEEHQKVNQDNFNLTLDSPGINVSNYEHQEVEKSTFNLTQHLEENNVTNDEHQAIDNSTLNLTLQSRKINVTQDEHQNTEENQPNLSLRSSTKDGHQKVKKKFFKVPSKSKKHSFKDGHLKFSTKERKRFAEECLFAHNKYRKMHNAQPLTLDSKLNSVSQKWANHLAQTNTFVHTHDNPYGENLYLFTTSEQITKLTMNGSEPVEAWYEQEIPLFTFGTENTDYKITGHFTQVIWADTKFLGVGVAKGVGRNTIYVVCEYDPPGNFEGELVVNVPPPVGYIFVIYYFIVKYNFLLNTKVNI